MKINQPAIMSSLFHIVLHQPEIPQNTGNIARSCAAFNSSLHLVKPLGFSLEDKYLKRAGMDYWPLIEKQTYNSLENFFQQNKGPFFYLSTKSGQDCSQLSYPLGSYFLFGRESAGLPEPLLKSCPEKCIRIPMLAQRRSLNLSNAAAIILYEALRQHSFTGLERKSPYFDES